jgi:hypothetical protein
MIGETVKKVSAVFSDWLVLRFTCGSLGRFSIGKSPNSAGEMFSYTTLLSSTGMTQKKVFRLILLV